MHAPHKLPPSALDPQHLNGAMPCYRHQRLLIVSLQSFSGAPQHSLAMHARCVTARGPDHLNPDPNPVPALTFDTALPLTLTVHRTSSGMEGSSRRGTAGRPPSKLRLLRSSLSRAAFAVARTVDAAPPVDAAAAAGATEPWTEPQLTQQLQVALHRVEPVLFFTGSPFHRPLGSSQQQLIRWTVSRALGGGGAMARGGGIPQVRRQLVVGGAGFRVCRAECLQQDGRRALKPRAPADASILMELPIRNMFSVIGILFREFGGQRIGQRVQM